MTVSSAHTQTITLRLPEALYRRAQAAAEAQQQPLEEIVLDAVATGMPLLDDLPPELAHEAAALSLLNDEALWRAARETMTLEQLEQFDMLVEQKGRADLPDDDQRRLDLLLNEYQRIVLLRAQAAVLLKLRGYDMSDPGVLNEPRSDYS